MPTKLRREIVAMVHPSHSVLSCNLGFQRQGKYMIFIMIACLFKFSMCLPTSIQVSLVLQLFIIAIDLINIFFFLYWVKFMIRTHCTSVFQMCSNLLNITPRVPWKRYDQCMQSCKRFRIESMTIRWVPYKPDYLLPSALSYVPWEWVKHDWIARRFSIVFQQCSQI